MESLARLFIELDAYGEAPKINYKGEATYKTAIGAFVTLMLRVFLLIYTIIKCIDVFQFKDPQIT